MAEIKQTVDCTYCKEENTVTIVFKQTKESRSVKVSKCSKCKKQNGVKSVLNNCR